MKIWPLAMLTGLLPLIAVLSAFVLSVEAGHVPDCQPLIDGCTTISRTGRQGSAFYVFKALMGPSAGILVVFWWLAAHELRSAWQAPRLATVVQLLGLVAGFSLAVYSSLLGSEVSAFAVYRRLGASVFFASVFLAQLLYITAVWSRESRYSWLRRAQFGVVLLQLALGLLSLPLTAWAGEPYKDFWENIIEWWIGLLMVLFFLLCAVAWRDHRLG